MEKTKNKRGRPQQEPKGLISARLPIDLIMRLYERAQANGATPSAEAAAILTRSLSR